MSSKFEIVLDKVDDICEKFEMEGLHSHPTYKQFKRLFAELKGAAPVGERQDGPTAEQEDAGCQAYMEADGMIGVMHRSSMGHAYMAMRALEPPAPVAVDDLQAIQDRHEAWMAGVEQGKAESELGAIKESEEFEKWRNAQIDVLIRNGYPEGAEAFRNLGSVQWAGWQARACLDKVKEMNR